MGVLDFLFEGRPPASVTTYGTTQQNVPSWLSDYTQGLIARANTVAAEPYQAYQGPRVSGFTPYQTDAQNMAKENVGKWSPYTDAAQSGYQGVLGGPGALSQAAPYLQAGTGSYTDQVEKYMNPYVENVIDRSTELASRKLQEQLMPAINSNFIRSGSYGSAAQQRATGQALRDVTGELQSQSRAALSDAYNQGAQLQGNEAMRQIQAGQLAGSLYGQDMSNRLQASQGLGGLGQLTSSLRGTDAAALAAAGADQQNQTQRNLDLAYQDFMNQRDYPKQQVGWMSDIIRGIPNMGGTTQTQQTGPAQAYGPSGISQLASLYSLYRGIKDEWGGSARGGVIRRSGGGLALARYAEGGKVQAVKRLADEIRKKGYSLGNTNWGSVKVRYNDGSTEILSGAVDWAKGDKVKKGDKLLTIVEADDVKYARGGLATVRRLSYGR
jgi:hypothetical protein